MLDLKDFIHLPVLDGLFDEIASCNQGLVVLAGLEPPRLEGTPIEAGVEAGGKSAILNILLRRLLRSRPIGPVLVVASTKDTMRIPARNRKQVEYAVEPQPQELANLFGRARSRGTRLVLVERVAPTNAGTILRAARAGLLLVTQLDTIFRGGQIARTLLDWGISQADLGGLAWVITAERLPLLCEHCKREDQVEPAQLEEIKRRWGEMERGAKFWRAEGCDECGGSGRKGVAAVFDVFRAPAHPARLSSEPSVLPMQKYILGLATQGYYNLDDVLNFETNELNRAYQLYTASEQALERQSAALQTKLTELEAARRVLRQQTEASMSLQKIGHALITLTGLEELGDYVCRKASELCGADRAALYLLRPDGSAEIVAVSGWNRGTLHMRLEGENVLDTIGNAQGGSETPVPFSGPPPGILLRTPDVEGARLRAGLRVPLVAQQEVVGILFFNSTWKKEFSPREAALLQAFANQSAVAIQRAGLYDALRDKIEQLEAAQAEIAKKERLERELELARQVQQSMLPKIFPLVPGFTFAARCEPARQVGGDLYDAFPLDEGRFGLVIADVSDKGMPAALYMALTRSLLLAEARRESSPAVVLKRVNQLLLELSGATLFVTIFYGVVDTAVRKMTYVRAGHERPLLLRDGRALTLSGEGQVIGFLEPTELKLGEDWVDLLPGDRLVLFTDGLTDALSPDGEAFGLERLTRLMERESREPLDRMCSAAFDEVLSHQGKNDQYDDMTLLAVQVQTQG